GARRARPPAPLRVGRPRRGRGTRGARQGAVGRLPDRGRALRCPGGPDRGDAADLRAPGHPRSGRPAAVDATLVGAHAEHRPRPPLHLGGAGGGVLHHLPGLLLQHLLRLRYLPGAEAGSDSRPAGGGGVRFLAISAPTWNLADDLRELVSYDFMRHALLGGTCIALAAGLVGYFVVLRNQVFTSDALGHAAFTGGLGSVLLGFPLLVGVYVASIGAALGMGALGGRARARDVAVGTLFAWVLGLGVLFLSLYTTARSTSNGALGIAVLFGSILGLQATHTAVAVVGGLATSAALLC